jgi:hypothetical protein
MSFLNQDQSRNFSEVSVSIDGKNLDQNPLQMNFTPDVSKNTERGTEISNSDTGQKVR